jgi:DNA-directed RNA polymerase subunit beta
MVVRARAAGTVTYVDAERIVINDTEEYLLRKFEGLNERTCLNQKPIVVKGQKVAAGADHRRRARDPQGELALGKNVLVGFMTFDGYNFEDAIVISERLVKDDVFTSIHIDSFDVEIRETKLGREEFTRGYSQRVGAGAAQPRRARRGAGRNRVGPGDILVGKVSQVQDRTQPGREAAARHLRSRRRGREKRLARGAFRRGKAS